MPEEEKNGVNPLLLPLIETIAKYLAGREFRRWSALSGEAMTEEELMLWGANHDLDPNSRTLLGAAVEQVALMEQAVVGFAETEINSAEVVSHHADTSTMSTTGIPPQVEARIMDAIEKQDSQKVVGLFADVRAQARRRTLFARAFVYELALFRKLIEQLAINQPTLAPGAKALVAKLDVIAPKAIALRDTLAHYDERAIGKARKLPVATVPHTSNGETLNRGLRLSGVTIGGHTADGAFAQIEVIPEVVAACRRLIKDAYALFPAKPGLQNAMENYRANFSA